MKQFLIGIAAALITIAGHAYGAEKDAAPVAPGSKAGARAADGHAHEHGQGDSPAIGAPGKATHVNRTIAVDMSDTMRFSPASITARQGETIRFTVKNSGKVKHEFVLDTEKGLKEHYELMKKFPEMEHSDPNRVTVAPGQAGEVIWRFTQAGRIDFACLQPGHYDAGMKGAVKVTAVKGKTTKTDGHADPKH